MYRKNKKTLVVMLFLLLSVSCVVGYAYLQRTLVINGSTTVEKNTWDVRFTTITPIKNDGEIITAPTVSNNTNLVFSEKLNKPGDVYIFTVVVENRGTLDAMVSGTPVITGLDDMNSYLDYSVTYADGTAITNGNLLRKDTKDTIRVTLNYKRNITEADIASLSESDVSKVMRLSISYVQADEAVASEVAHKLCIKADNLHTETCNGASGEGCLENGYSQGDTITYGHTDSTKLVSGSLTSGTSQGYALTCDVNGDSVYDEATERFYYVSDFYDTNTNTFDNSYATLIYSNNIAKSAYNGTSESSNNYSGPTDLLSYLSSSSTWSNTNLALKNTTRQIRSNKNTTTSNNGNSNLPSFTYTGRVARLLTTRELSSAASQTSQVTTIAGYLDNVEFLMEDTYYSKTNNCSGDSCYYWLETPSSADDIDIWYMIGTKRYVYHQRASFNYGVRPVIDVLKTNINLN